MVVHRPKGLEEYGVIPGCTLDIPNPFLPVIFDSSETPKNHLPSNHGMRASSRQRRLLHPGHVLNQTSRERPPAGKPRLSVFTFLARLKPLSAERG
jgi:hypothetical protein